MVPIGVTGLERGAIAGAQDFLTFIRDEDEFALQYPDELIFGAVPMPLG